MHKWYLFILFLCFYTNKGFSNIIDADTGKSVPCVGVFVSKVNTIIPKCSENSGMKAALTDTPSTLARLSDRARMFGERIPQEKVFVHMDNTGYFLGDTIWFAAYTRRTDTGRPSKISRVLYAELWNHDGYLVERKLVEMRDGRGHGFFALPDTLYSGYFELRAYTRWQLNWGQTEHPHNKNTELWFYNKEMAQEYFRDYEKLYSRVFPVYDKPKQEGEYTRDMTLRPLRRYFRKDEKKPELVLSLFPEGGNLVAGVPCRMAFEAAHEDGEAMQGRVALQMKNEKVKIKNERDEEVTEVRTEHRGRGSFSFTPEDGKTYEVIFTTDDGETAKAKLKDIAKEGVALQVTQEDSVWNFQIHSSVGKPLGLTLMHEGVTSHFWEIKNEEIKIKNEGLPTGVNQATVFDEEGHVWADRLFFVMKSEVTKPTLAITGMKEQYEPYEQVNLDVRCLSSDVEPQNLTPSISLAVRDAALQDYTFDSGNIMTEMLLSSEIKGFVPQPEWYFESDDKEHRRGLDLLLMTQGWRRFAWHDMAVPGTWEITHPAEQSQVVTGTVNNYDVDYLKIAWAEEMGLNLREDEDPLKHQEHREPDKIGDILAQIKKHREKGDEQKIESLLSELSSFMSEREILKIRWEDPLRHRDYRDFSIAGKEHGQEDFDWFVKQGWEQQEGIRSLFLYPSKRFHHHKDLKHEVCVHTEIVKPDAPKGQESGIVGEMTTKDGGHFKLELPRFYGDCLLFVTAQDTSNWDRRHRLWLKEFRQHAWIKLEDNDEQERLHEDAEFYVRLSFPHPRWVKPYNWYQTHSTKQDLQTQYIGETGVKMLHETTVRSKRNGLRRMNLSHPTYIVDAYEAFNQTMDAGLLTQPYFPINFMPEWEIRTVADFSMAMAYNYIGDMDTKRLFDFSLYFDSLKVYTLHPNMVGNNLTHTSNDIMGQDAKEWINYVINPSASRHNAQLQFLDKIYIYTDYSPRNEGSERYQQDDQPSVEVSLHRLPENERRVTYRDRRYILHGFAYQEDFYHPDYSRQHPTEPTDHRRTLYWNPDLTLDENGHATVTFWNNSRHNQLSVSAEGMSKDGELLSTSK